MAFLTYLLLRSLRENVGVDAARVWCVYFSSSYSVSLCRMFFAREILIAALRSLCPLRVAANKALVERALAPSRHAPESSLRLRSKHDESGATPAVRAAHERSRA